MHPRCRCTTTIDMDYMKRIARDPVTGKNTIIDHDITYKEWKASLTPEQREAMELSQKMARNKSADMRQFEKYKEVLGKDMPKSFDKFVQMKYNGGEKWGFVKLDYSRQMKLINNPELKLPNAEAATAAKEKFTKYLFNSASKQGYPKGKAFESRLGYNADNYEKLRKAITEKSARYPAALKGSNDYGNLYEQKIIIYGIKDTPANVVVGWIDSGSETKMTSAYIKEVKK